MQVTSYYKFSDLTSNIEESPPWKFLHECLWAWQSTCSKSGCLDHQHKWASVASQKSPTTTSSFRQGVLSSGTTFCSLPPKPFKIIGVQQHGTLRLRPNREKWVLHPDAGITVCTETGFRYIASFLHNLLSLLGGCYPHDIDMDKLNKHLIFKVSTLPKMEDIWVAIFGGQRLLNNAVKWSKLQEEGVILPSRSKTLCAFLWTSAQP